MRIATFRLDVMPPVGATMVYRTNRKARSALFIHGLVINDAPLRAVIVACGFIYMWGQAWVNWRKAIAQAAETDQDNVFLHTIHQHDSMLIAEGSHQNGKIRTEPSHCQDTLQRLLRTVTIAVSDHWLTVSQILTAEHRIHDLTSNNLIISSRESA